jgi:pre-mRNA-splicing factor CWC22
MLQVNTSNIKMIVPELFGENLIRGKGLYCRSIMKAQAASIPFTPIYASLTAIINTKIPSIGELLLTRLIVQFRKAYRRNDKAVCLSSTIFIAHLCNQQVAHEIVALQILSLLLQNPTDDSVEVAVGFMRHIGAFLAEQSPKANTGVYERFRAVLHEGAIDKRVQYMIEVLFQVRKDGYKDNPIIPPDLDLVEEDEAITHYLSLDDELDGQESLGVFKFDDQYEENEEKYAQIKAGILGEGSDDESDEDSDDSDIEDQEVGMKIPISLSNVRSKETDRDSRRDKHKYRQPSSNNFLNHHVFRRLRRMLPQTYENRPPRRTRNGTGQHDHRMWFPRTYILSILRSRGRTIL